MSDSGKSRSRWRGYREMSPSTFQSLTKRPKNELQESSKTSFPISEASLQIQCLDWVRLQYPTLLIFHVPNALAFAGGERGAFYRKLASLKRLGVVKGIPDLVIARAARGFHGLYIEMKKPGEKPDLHQKSIHRQINGSGYLAYVCDSFEEFQTVLRWYNGDHELPEPPGSPSTP